MYRRYLFEGPCLRPLLETVRTLQHEVEANARIQIVADSSSDGGGGGGEEAQGPGGGGGGGLTLEVKGEAVEVMGEDEAQARTQETLSHLYTALETVIMFLKDESKPIPKQVIMTVAPPHATPLAARTRDATSRTW